MREEHRERSDQVWAGRADESDEHLVANEIGHVVRVRALRRVENENSGPDVVRLASTPSYLKPDGDDVEVQKKRWTPMEGCNTCGSPHGNDHVVRCDARRYEYRWKFRRKPPLTTPPAYHEPGRAPQGARPVPNESNPVSGREKEQVASYQ